MEFDEILKAIENGEVDLVPKEKPTDVEQAILSGNYEVRAKPNKVDLKTELLKDLEEARRTGNVTNEMRAVSQLKSMGIG